MSYYLNLFYLLLLMQKFNLKSPYLPAGDQGKAIDLLTKGFESGNKIQTLYGATGTGKTFTMANLIQNLQKPTLVLSHNKTLAAQLATEFKYFFPDNAVHYFISYFDYYQPESYLPLQDIYIEKEATVNLEIQMYRLSTLASLLTRKDVIVVASVSSLYGLGKKEFFKNLSLTLETGKSYSFDEIKKQLIKMQYKPAKSKIEQGMFDIHGEVIEIFSSIEKVVYQLYFNEDVLEYIIKRDSLSWKDLGLYNKIVIWPATQFLQDSEDLNKIIENIKKEANLVSDFFKKNGKILESQRIKKRVDYDMRMVYETGWTNGIENYSPYFDGRGKGEPPNTLFDYFPDDFLLIVDESHMTIPQLQAMPGADFSRKVNLIKHGFRLPSALDHRPINFFELSSTLGWPITNIKKDTDFKKSISKDKFLLDLLDLDKFRKQSDFKLQNFYKSKSKTLFVSATPSDYEVSISDNIVEQIIRPTGLLDPLTYVYPKSGNYRDLLKSLDDLIFSKKDLKEKLV